SKVVQTVVAQIRQTFGSRYDDPNSGDKRQVSGCFVIASGNFPKESKTAIRATIASDYLNALTTMYDGTELWTLIEKHLSELLVKRHLDSAINFFNTADPNWSIDFAVKGGDRFFELVPKGPDAPPIAMSITPNFPDTPKGKEAQEAYEVFQRDGT